MWLSACAPAADPVAEAPAEESATTETGDSGAGPVDCSESPRPEPPDVIDISPSEDFGFTADGWMVHVTDQLDLVRESYEGDFELVFPQLGSVAGITVLPDGDVVVANLSTGSLERVGMDGSLQTLLGGLAYPNGLDLGADGFLYVAEQVAGRLRRVDPETGDWQAIGEGMNNPNGVAAAADGDLYVGSFGGGVVYKLSYLGDSWGPAELWAGREGAFALNTDPCVDMAEGEACWRVGGLGPGLCASSDAGLRCTAQPDLGACEGLEPGAACETELLGEDYDSLCSEGDEGLFCPAVDDYRITACEAGTMWGPCSIGLSDGYCESSFEGVLACVTNEEAWDAYVDDCEGRAEGDSCAYRSPTRPDQGSCVDGSAYGYDALLCLSASYLAWEDGGGGFDAIGVDECGAVYVGEYLTGAVYRWPEGGESPETLIELDSAWIPNMHWGNDAGGWDSRALYVMDRDRSGGAFEVELGIGAGDP